MLPGEALETCKGQGIHPSARICQYHCVAATPAWLAALSQQDLECVKQFALIHSPVRSAASEVSALALRWLERSSSWCKAPVRCAGQITLLQEGGCCWL